VPHEIDIGVWDRLITKAHLKYVQARHPAVEWLLAVLRASRGYYRGLQADPGMLKKLLRAVHYQTTWRNAREARMRGEWTR
jgi:hypothetical protein